jgi:hypothetical protein
VVLNPEAVRDVVVSKKGRRRAFIPRFMLERSIRTALQNLYVAAIGSTSNAKLLAERNPWDIDWKLIKGNELVKKCFISATLWLINNHDFTFSEKIYEQQILEPARSAAQFILFF